MTPTSQATTAPPAALSAPAPQALSPGRFKAAILAALMTILLGALEQTIVAVAVPTIAQQLGGFGWMAWVVSAYLIASTSVTPLYGSFSDVYGRRRVMTVAIVLFTLGSAACALAPSLPWLVAARVLQGFGGGGLIAMAQAVVADVVPMRERGRYQGYISMVWALASVSGPLVGGLLTEFLSWPWIFWINLPFCAVALALVVTALPRQPAHQRRAGFDVPGIVLLVVGLVSLLLTVTRIGQGVSWAAPMSLAGFGVAAVALSALAWWEQRAAKPILPITLLRLPAVWAGCSMLFLCFFLFIALSVLVPLRVQLLTGATESQAALRLLPLSLGIPLAAFVCGRYIQATGKLKPLQKLGVAIVPFAMAALAFVPPGHLVLTSLLLLALGVGFGTQLPTGLLTIQNSVPRELMGTATAITAFFRQLGGAVGIAVLSAVLLALLREALPAGAAAAGVEGLGQLFEQARHGGTTDAAAWAANDAAFRATLLVGAVASLGSWALVRRVPDLRV